MNIIDGKYYANKIIAKLKNEIALASSTYRSAPTLAIIIVGNDYASSKYVDNKIRAASEVGIKSSKTNLPIDVHHEELLSIIERFNTDQRISGIIVQLPLPAHIDKDIILSAIDPKKDVDGFHPINVGYLSSGIKKGFVPSTALGILELIKQYEDDLKGKHAVIIGRSNIVGKPLAFLLLNEDCTVTICHSKTINLQNITVQADIVISAVGEAKFLTANYFNSNAIVVDVGINRDRESGKITGDLNFEDVSDKVRYLTPVPGGVGPMTVAFLLKNTLKAFLNQHQSSGKYEQIN